MTVDRATRPLSAVEAARILYRTEAPSPEQVWEVEKKLAAGVIRGELRGKRKLAWTTTADDVADYMAQHAVQRRDAKAKKRPGGQGGAADSPPEGTVAGEQAELARDVYREVLKDYFLALIFRRRSRRFSKQFQRTVVAGQVATLVLIVTAFALALRPAFEPTPPERVAIERWLSRHHERFTVLHWHPPTPAPEEGELRVRVEYRYLNGRNKSVKTDRTFAVEGGQVRRLE